MVIECLWNDTDRRKPKYSSIVICDAVLLWQVVSAIWKENSTFVQEDLDCLALKKKTLWCSEMCGTTFPVTQWHIWEDLNLQQNCCESHRSRKTDILREKCVIVNWNIGQYYQKSWVIYSDNKLCHICTTYYCKAYFNVMFMFTLRLRT